DSGRNALRRAAVAIAVFLALAALLFLFGPDDFYPWAKAIHVVAVISWLAGMLYLPRLFVYHAVVEKGSVQSETFKGLGWRVLRGLIHPAMTVIWACGLWLACKGGLFSAGWLHPTFAPVILMSAVHGPMPGAVRKSVEDRNQTPARHWRIVNG